MMIRAYHTLSSGNDGCGGYDITQAVTTHQGKRHFPGCFVPFCFHIKWSLQFPPPETSDMLYSSDNLRLLISRDPRGCFPSHCSSFLLEVMKPQVFGKNKAFCLACSFKFSSYC